MAYCETFIKVIVTSLSVDEQDNELRKAPKEFLTVDMKKKVIKEIVLRGFDPKKYYFGSYKASNLTVYVCH